MEEFRNTDGSYNGVKALAKISGLTEAEVEWTFNRFKQLKLEGKTMPESKAIVKAEVKLKPWEKVCNSTEQK